VAEHELGKQALENKAAAEPPPVCLLDASIYIFRYYFSMPERWFSAVGSSPTDAVYGYTGFLLDFIQRERPIYMAACFDESLGSCFRNEIYPDYKASRALPDEALAFQLNACREVTELLGIACFSSEVYEADDLLGSLMSWGHTAPELADRPFALLTRDKDLGQLLIRNEDFLWHYHSDKSKEERRDRQVIFEAFGVRPEQLVDYLALVGDSVDDIPGVPGIGAKTASVLLQYFGSFENLYARLDELPSLKIRGAKNLVVKLREYYQQALMSRSLAAIVTDVELELSPNKMTRQCIDLQGFSDFCQRMGFGAAFEKRVNACVE